MSFSSKISTAFSIANSRSTPASITVGPAPTKRTNPTAFSLSTLGASAWAVLNASILCLNLLTWSGVITEAASIDWLIILKFFFPPRQQSHGEYFSTPEHSL